MQSLGNKCYYLGGKNKSLLCFAKFSKLKIYVEFDLAREISQNEIFDTLR